MKLPRDVLQHLAHRVARNHLEADPDTLHGVLLLAEQRGGLDQIAVASRVAPAGLAPLLDRARSGEAGRVPAWRGTPAQAEYADWEIRKQRHAKMKRAEARSR